MSTSEVFKEFYSKLVKTLPLCDAVFVAELYSYDLLPDDIKELVELQPTLAHKAMYFLDHVIKPNVTSDDGSSFDKLLNVMEDSEYQGVKELAEQIRSAIQKKSITGKGNLLNFSMISRDETNIKIWCSNILYINKRINKYILYYCTCKSE